MRHSNLLVFSVLISFPAHSFVVSNSNGGRRSPHSFHPQSPRSQILPKSHGESIVFKNHNRPSFRDVQLCQQLAKCKSARDVIDVLRPFAQNQSSPIISNLSSVCLCTAFHRIAKDPSRQVSDFKGLDEMIFRQLVSAIHSVMYQARSGFECRHIANIAWAAARLNLGYRVDLNGSGLFAVLARETVLRIKSFR